MLSRRVFPRSPRAGARTARPPRTRRRTARLWRPRRHRRRDDIDDPSTKGRRITGASFIQLAAQRTNPPLAFGAFSGEGSSSRRFVDDGPGRAVSTPTFRVFGRRLRRLIRDFAKTDARQSLAPKLPRKPESRQSENSAYSAPRRRKQLTRPVRKRSERRGPPRGCPISRFALAPTCALPHSPAILIPTRSIVPRHHSTENYHGLTSTSHPPSNNQRCKAVVLRNLRNFLYGDTLQRKCESTCLSLCFVQGKISGPRRRHEERFRLISTFIRVGPQTAPRGRT